MTVFRKRTPAAQTAAIATFWQWWSPTGADLVAAAIESHDLKNVARLISGRLRPIHRRLSWELGEGTSSQHRFTVTAVGSPELRPLVEEWLLRAPEASETWEFASSRQRVTGATPLSVEIAGQLLVLNDSRISIVVNDDRRLVQVGVFHPLFGGLREKERLQFVFLLLDWLLGEDDVERWIGHIEAVQSEPDDGVPCATLIDVVDAMAARHAPQSR